MEHYQVRLVKRIDNDGKIITFQEKLGKMYQLHDQKTLKSCDNIDEATTIAKNLNSGFTPEVKGMVIVKFKPGKVIIASGSVVKPHVKSHVRRSETTEWLFFISKDNKVFSVSPKSHKIATELNA